MELKIINTNEDKTNKIYSSTDCQQLINSRTNIIQKSVSISLGLVTSFLITIRLLGLVVSQDNPKTEKLKLHTGRLKNLKDKELLLLPVKNLSQFQKKLTLQ